MKLKRLEERMKKGWVRSSLDGLLGNRYHLVYIFLLFLLLGLHIWVVVNTNSRSC